MARYAASAVPWVRVVLAACLVLVLMEVVARWPWQMWPLEGVSVGLLAGAAAWCFDEQSHAVVDVAPRGPAWRAVARSSGVLVLLTAWALAVGRSHSSLFGHSGEVALQGVAAVAAGAAWTLWRRGRGEGAPGMRLSLVVLPLATVWALVRPFARTFPLFPYASDVRYGDWSWSGPLWALCLIASTGLLAAAMSEEPWWRIRTLPATPTN